MNATIEANFFNPKIRELPLDYVRDWYSGAYEPNGVPRETWTYLLPRILEILASGEDTSSTGLEVSLKRFETGNPQKWSGEQWEVLDNFQRAYLKQYIENGRGYLDDVICMFKLGGWPLDDLLDQIATVPDKKLAHRLWHDWCAESVIGGASIWVTAFWESPDNTKVFEFYTSRELHIRMEALALSEDAGTEIAAMASAVVSVIEANAAWFPQRA